MRTASLWAITQWAVVIPYWWFGTMHWVPSWPYNKGPTGCPELSVRNCHCLLRNSPDKGSSLKRTAVYSVRSEHSFTSYNVHNAVHQLSYRDCSKLYHPVARTVMAQFYSSTKSDFTVGFPELDSDTHFNVWTTGLTFNLSTRFMENVLFQQKR